VKTFKIVTLGCKVNQAESDTLAARLAGQGWRPAGPAEQADLCIVNTCTVTQKAAMQSRQAVRQAIQAHPRACVTVTGCYAETDPSALAAIPGVDYIVDQSGKAELDRIIEAVGPQRRAQPTRLTGSTPGAPPPVAPDVSASGPLRGRTRPFVKIQDGCDAFCTYCIVPYARGRSRSASADSIIGAVRHLAAKGFLEVVLTGIHIGRYGRDQDPPASLFGLLRLLEASTEGVRLRLSSLEPLEVTPEIVALVAGSGRFCRHFHLPLQSGDARVLQRMGRPYGPGEFAAAVESIHRSMPEAAIGADVLVGFPGESEPAFRNTCALVEALPLSYLHVFPFSARPGTAAFDFPDRVPDPVIKARCRQLRRLGLAKRSAFHARFIGREVDALTESRRDPKTGQLKGVSDNYLPVVFEGGDEHMGRVRRVAVTGLAAAGLRGELVGDPLQI
jgi:threonylcarbamoyladenosine tRNA methylthiotransferase MtaB